MFGPDDGSVQCEAFGFRSDLLLISHQRFSFPATCLLFLFLERPTLARGFNLYMWAISADL